MESEKSWGKDHTPHGGPPGNLPLGATAPSRHKTAGGRRGWCEEGSGEQKGLGSCQGRCPHQLSPPPASHLCLPSAPSFSFTWDLVDSFGSGSFCLIQTCCSDALNLLALDPKLVPSPHSQYFYLAMSKFWFPTLPSDLGSGLLTNTHTFYENNTVLKINSKIVLILQTSWHEEQPWLQDTLQL